MRPRTSPLWAENSSEIARPALTEPRACDVAIIGAGFSGLWLAYWLSRRRPDLSIVVLEAATVGFGASGRNGGWLSALLPASLTDLAESIGDEPTGRLQTRMFSAVAEVGQLCQDESVACDLTHGGSISLIRTDEQRKRAEVDLADYAKFDFAEHARWNSVATTRERIGVDAESVYRPDWAVLHPRRLVDGLARIVESSGVSIHENSPVTKIDGRRVVTNASEVRSRWIIDCREAFAAPTSRRRIIPIYSLMIATEPLSPTTWARIGLANREAFTDHRHQLVYGQRTIDGRLAFGGRGVGYHFGSRIDPTFEQNERVHDDLRRSLIELFPDLHDVAITHRWGGPLAAPRDWIWTARLDQRTGNGLVGGYVGDGVTSAYVAGRAMADAIIDESSTFPLYGHRSPSWEIEPFRWIGVNTMSRLAGVLDRRETAGKRSPFLARIFQRLVG